MAIPIIVIILGLLGFADSLYYTLVHYGALGFGSPLMPMICDHNRGVCEMLASTRWASLLGPPNSLFGMFYYGLMVLVGLATLHFGHWPYLRVVQGMAVVAALFSVYLAWVMVFQVRQVCPLCAFAQGINVVLAVLLLLVPRSSWCPT